MPDATQPGAPGLPPPPPPPPPMPMPAAAAPGAPPPLPPLQGAAPSVPAPTPPQEAQQPFVQEQSQAPQIPVFVPAGATVAPPQPSAPAPPPPAPAPPPQQVAPAPEPQYQQQAPTPQELHAQNPTPQMPMPAPPGYEQQQYQQPAQQYAQPQVAPQPPNMGAPGQPAFPPQGYAPQPQVAAPQAGPQGGLGQEFAQLMQSANVGPGGAGAGPAGLLNKYNVSGVEDSNFRTIPVEHTYESRITGVKASTTQAGADMLVITLKTVHPHPHTGVTLTDYLPIMDSTLWRYKSFLRAAGMLDPTGSFCSAQRWEDFNGRVVRHQILHEEYPKGSGQMRNKVNGSYSEAYEHLQAAQQPPAPQMYAQPPQAYVQPQPAMQFQQPPVAQPQQYPQQVPPGYAPQPAPQYVQQPGAQAGYPPAYPGQPNFGNQG